MPRNKTVAKRRVDGDPIYNSRQVTKLINRAMKDGEKSPAQKEVYEALEKVSKTLNLPPIEALNQALENIKPQMEVRPRRIGGAAYQVPMPVRGERKESLAIRWLIIGARAKANKEFHTFADKLAAEIIDAFNNTGMAIKKKSDMQKLAEVNKAFAHFKW